MQNLEAVLEKLREKFPEFEMREGQLAMLKDVWSAYRENKTFLIEAGTGTGKSLAYLVPAILWALEEKEPTVIATHTISLQEQLVQKDIPFLIEALGIDLKVVLAKGMHNYVCLRKLNEGSQDIPEAVFQWAKTTKEGTRSELPVHPSPELWDEVSADFDSCSNAKCRYYKECFFFRARKEIEDAHLIIANHHLLFADLAIKEETGARYIFPPFKKLILDEAHHIEDAATEYFAERVSKKLLLHALSKLFSDKSGGKLPLLLKKISECYPGDKEQEGLSEILNALEWILPLEKKQISEEIEMLFDLVEHKFPQQLRIREMHLRDPFWQQILQPNVEALQERGYRFLSSVELLGDKIVRRNESFLTAACEGVIADIQGICTRLRRYFEFLAHFVFNPLEEKKVRWIEDGNLISADLDIAPTLSSALFQKIPSIVLCSATLSTNGDFSFARKRLGIYENFSESIYESPFNYEKQAFLTVPTDLPDPSHETFTLKASEFIFSSVEASNGSAFVLFTSYAMMKECERILKPGLLENRYSLFCQNDQSRNALLNNFRNTKKAVLFGTDSFWEGVDVVGDALRLVIIVKLPFKAPTDPLFEARSEFITKNGGSPFFHYSLPSAIVKFKQGFGRLIRNKDDRGCVVCLDSRLIRKGYGKKFLKSLPACPYFFEPKEGVRRKLNEFYKKK